MRLDLPRLNLPDVTLWSIAWGHPESVQRIKRVLRYCQGIAQFGKTLFFSTIPESAQEGMESDPWQTIPVKCRNFYDFNRLMSRFVPPYLNTQFALAVQEDGFPLRPGLWSEDFLGCDYIGAPWPDKVVGNGGFYLESQKMILARMKLPDNPNSLPPLGNVDWYWCRTSQSVLAAQGVRFAPFELAARFSSECTGQSQPTFGFHGRDYNPSSYRLGWDLIKGSEPCTS